MKAKVSFFKAMEKAHLKGGESPTEFGKHNREFAEMMAEDQLSFSETERHHMLSIGDDDDDDNVMLQ